MNSINNRKLYVHFSIDDVINCLLWITKQNAGSIFESKIIKFAREINNRYGLGVTMNCMYENGKGDTLNCVNEKWKREFENNSAWLRLAFHCYSPNSKYDDKSEYIIEEEYKKVNRELKRISGKCVDGSILRLHFFCASKSVVKWLFDNGVKCLLAADDNRLSYDCTITENETVNAEGKYIADDGRMYVKTDFRAEAFDGQIDFEIKRERLVFFTHERLLMNDEYQNMIFEYLDRLCEEYELTDWRQT